MATTLARSAFRIALVCGAVGFGVAVLLLLVSLLPLRNDAISGVELILWPSSFAFMALDNATSTRLDWIEGTAFLMLTNFVMYFVIGFLAALVWKGVVKLRARHAKLRA